MINEKRLLLVEDDDAIRETLRDQLREEFSIVEAARGAEALELAEASHHDLIILDVGLPDMDGLDVCKLMRRAGINAPVIMLTGADTEADTVLGLDWGANDYVTNSILRREFGFGDGFIISDCNDIPALVSFRVAEAVSPARGSVPPRNPSRPSPSEAARRLREPRPGPPSPWSRGTPPRSPPAPRLRYPASSPPRADRHAAV